MQAFKTQTLKFDSLLVIKQDQLYFENIKFAQTRENPCRQNSKNPAYRTQCPAYIFVLFLISSNVASTSY